MKDLVRGKMIIGVSGKGGGYRLARKPEDYPVGEIIELMEGNLTAVACLENDAMPCPRAAMCETLPMWKEFDELVHHFFYSKKLSDLAAK